MKKTEVKRISYVDNKELEELKKLNALQVLEEKKKHEAIAKQQREKATKRKELNKETKKEETKKEETKKEETKKETSKKETGKDIKIQKALSNTSNFKGYSLKELEDLKGLLEDYKQASLTKEYLGSQKEVYTLAYTLSKEELKKIDNRLYKINAKIEDLEELKELNSVKAIFNQSYKMNKEQKDFFKEVNFELYHLMNGNIKDIIKIEELKSYVFCVNLTKSVLNKVYAQSGNIHILRLMNELYYSNLHLQALDFASEKSFEVDFFYNGDKKEVTEETEEAFEDYKEASYFASQSLDSDGIDFVNFAFAKLLEYLQAVYKDNYKDIDITKKHDIEVMNRRTLRINDKIEYKTVHKSIIQLLYSDVRSYIYNHNKDYSFKPLEVTEDFYHVDVFGRQYPYRYETSNDIFEDIRTLPKDIKSMDEVMQALKFTRQQRDIVNLLSVGYSLQATAKILDKSVNTIKVTRNRLKKRLQSKDFKAMLEDRLEEVIKDKKKK